MAVLKALPADLFDGVLAEYKKPEDLIGENGLLKQITKAVVERALQGRASLENCRSSFPASATAASSRSLIPGRGPFEAVRILGSILQPPASAVDESL